MTTVEDTCTRKSKRKTLFSFAFHSLIRTFDCRRKYLHSEKQKKIFIFFCFSLAYSYLCTSKAKHL